MGRHPYSVVFAYRDERVWEEGVSHTAEPAAWHTSFVCEARELEATCEVSIRAEYVIAGSIQPHGTKFDDVQASLTPPCPSVLCRSSTRSPVGPQEAAQHDGLVGAT